MEGGEGGVLLALPAFFISLIPSFLPKIRVPGSPGPFPRSATVPLTTIPFASCVRSSQ